MSGGTLKGRWSARRRARVRYDMTTTRTGRSGNSNSRQSGNVTVGDDGKAALSQVPST